MTGMYRKVINEKEFIIIIEEKGLVAENLERTNLNNKNVGKNTCSSEELRRPLKSRQRKFIVIASTSVVIS